MVRPATPDRWDDVVTVMGVRGDPARCWCQFFHQRGRIERSASREENREALRAEVCSGELPPGVLGYVDGEPAGWCAVAPKASYSRLLASPVAGPDVDGVWSVTCFVVRVGFRREGMSAALLAGAVDLARAAGAKTLEGYSVDRNARASVSSAELYHGPLSVFLGAGFTEVERPSASRARVRLDLGPHVDS